MDASKIKVSREDMAVIKPEQLGLSPFGVLSSLFQQELEQRIRLETGAYAPLPLTLREEDEEPDAAPPVEVELSVDIHMDAPKAAPARKEPEKKSGVREAALETRILEKVRIKERELQKKQEVLHKLEIRLEEGRWTQPPTAGGQSQSVAAQPLTLATRAAAVPSAGGWAPQTLPAHPGYPAPKSQEDGQAAGGSILLPDVLRRRREQALQRQAQPQLEWLHQSELSPDTARQMMHAVHQAVEQTLALNHAKNPALSGQSRTEPPTGPARKPQAEPLSWQDAAEPSAPAQPAAGQAVPTDGPSAQAPALTHKARLSQEPHLPYNSQNAEKGAHPSRRPGPEPSSNSRDASEAGGMERRATSAKEQGQAWPAENTQASQSPALQEREPLKAMRGSELQGHDSSGSVQSLEPQEQANGPDAVPQALPVESAQAPALMQEPLIYRESEAETTRPADHKAPAQATGETTHPNQTTHARSSAQAENNTNRPIWTNYAHPSAQAETGTELQEREPLKAMRGSELQEQDPHKAMQVSELQGQDSSGSVQAAKLQEQATGPDAAPQALPAESTQAPAPMQEPLIYRENEAETAHLANHKAPAQATGETAHPHQATHARSSAPAENNTNRLIQTNYAHLSAQAETGTNHPARTTHEQFSAQAENNTDRPAGRRPAAQTGQESSRVVEALEMQDRESHKAMRVSKLQEEDPHRAAQSPALQEREPHKAMQVSELQGQDSSGSMQSLEPQEQAAGPEAVLQAWPAESAQVPAPMQESLIYRENEAETTRPADRQTSAQTPSEIARPAQTTRARSSAQAENNTNRPIRTNYAQSSVQAETGTNHPARTTHEQSSAQAESNANRPIQANYAQSSVQAEKDTGRTDREKGQAAAQMLTPAMARAAWAAEQLVYRAQEAAGQAPAQNPPSALPAQDRSVASSARPIALTLHRGAVQSGNPAARDIRLVHPVPAAGDGVPGQEQPSQLVLAGGGSPELSRSDRPEQARGMEALPDWARELLEKGPLPKGPRPAQAGPRQFQWTSPQAMAAPGGTAQTVLPQGQAAQSAAPPQLSNAAQVPPSLIHPQKNEEEQSARQKAEREAEIRRTADRVYRIIEERLRRELRRSGR